MNNERSTDRNSIKAKTTLLLFLGACLAAITSARAQTTFTRITNSVIASDSGFYTRFAWGDFNNNGFLDLFVSTWNNRTNVFYLNNGDATFTKVIQGDPVQDADYHIGAAAADFDNDGSLDLVVLAGWGAPVARRNLLYHGNGNGTFSRTSGGSVTNQLGFFDACTWADYDKDGFVDLFVTDNGTSTDTGGRNLLFHNNGDGTFTKITAGAVVNDVGVGVGALWCDYDHDGYPDLVVINLVISGHNFLYHNNRDGTFTRIATNCPIATDTWPSGAQGADWGDYDNDGLPDLFVTDANGSGRNRLYHNNGNGSFTNVTSGSIVTNGLGGRGAVWGDYDNDGYLDLFIAEHSAPNGLFHNNGDGTFTRILAGAPVTDDGGPNLFTHGVSWVDYDNDGFLDLFIALSSVSASGTNLLYHNNRNSNGWVEIKLVGTLANRSGIGAKVRAKATIGGKTFRQMREVDNGGGWNCAPLVAHFGLGDATNIDTLRIEWPSGTVQEFHDVAAKQILTITEPPRLIAGTTNGTPQFSVKGGRGMQYDIQTSADLTTWSLLDTLLITNLNGTAVINDTNPPGADQRFFRAVSH